jgi:ssDNA-binding protein
VQTFSIDIRLENVRLSFPSIFKPNENSQFKNDKGESKYEATFLLDKVKDAIQIQKIREALKDIGMKAWPAGWPKSLEVCLQDGDKKEYDGYAGKMYIKGSSSKRPAVIHRDKSPIVESDGIVYAGCYVNAVIRLWVQDNKFGKRINAALNGIQFVRDGDPFGSKFDADAAFEVIEPGADYTEIDPIDDPNSERFVAQSDMPF